MGIEEIIRQIIIDELDKRIELIVGAIANQLNNEEGKEKFGNASKAAKRFGVHRNTIKNWSNARHFKKYPIEGTVLYLSLIHI